MFKYYDCLDRIMLNIGDIAAVDRPSVMETILGSCVSVCLWDAGSGIGGMNHYLLPEKLSASNNPACCGPEAVDMLLSSLMRLGADRPGLRAKIFGGGSAVSALTERFSMGKRNVEAARSALAWHRIPIVGEFTAPDCSIKLAFHNRDGRAFVKKLGGGNALLREEIWSREE